MRRFVPKQRKNKASASETVWGRRERMINDSPTSRGQSGRDETSQYGRMISILHT